jgi:Adenylosuccinate lyase C-terminus
MALAPHVGRQRGHDLIYTAAHAAITEKRPVLDVLAKDPEISRHLDRTALAELLDPRHYVGLSATMADPVLTGRRLARRSLATVPDEGDEPRARGASDRRPQLDAGGLGARARTGLAMKRPEETEMPSKTTWTPQETHGRLTKQSDLPDAVFAFPKQRKEPLTDAQHVRNAVARFDQVTGVSDSDRALAFANIEKAAEYYGVNLSETDWHQLGVHPQQN